MCVECLIGKQKPEKPILFKVTEPVTVSCEARPRLVKCVSLFCVIDTGSNRAPGPDQGDRIGGYLSKRRVETCNLHKMIYMCVSLFYVIDTGSSVVPTGEIFI